jgi:LDH2 family malate/lactate/ureidoglycolate dehydrogenase
MLSSRAMHEPELIRIDAAQERDLIVDVLRKLGAGEDGAADQARVLVVGDLRGRPSHGLQRLPVIARGRRGQELPPGSAVDADGYPTADPVAADDGAISPVGGRKGFAPLWHELSKLRDRLGGEASTRA